MPFINELLNYSNDYFVETGTYQGDSIEIIKNSGKFKYIYSIELSEIFYYNCVNRFINETNIKLFKGNSRYDLFKMIFNIDSNITFWLDGHWSGIVDVGCDKELLCPVLHELEQIKKHHINTHTIIIDDIRLMDGSHFKVTIEQIIDKLIQINSNYKIIFYDNLNIESDILVAYIDDLYDIKKEKHTCIHKYLTICKTNPQPPGFADFLRGTIALFNYTKTYNYNLYIDNSHPIFEFFQPHSQLIENNTTNEVLELLPPLTYIDIDKKIKDSFINNKSFCIMTNSFYNKDNNVIKHNFGKISNECKCFLKEFLTPNIELNIHIQKIFNDLNINYNEDFNIIHLRLGDKFIKCNSFDNVIFDNVNQLIKQILLGNKSQKFILMSDSSEISIKLKENNPSLYYWKNYKVHLGELKCEPNIKTVKHAIRDTLTDFFIMSKSKNIYAYSSYGSTGFSKIISLIYDINYFSIEI